MTGGHFDYSEYSIQRIAEEIDTLVRNNASFEKNSWGDPVGHDYPPEIIIRFEEAVMLLRRAAVYAHRIDYLLCGDDKEKSFLAHLKEDLEALS